MRMDRILEITMHQDLSMFFLIRSQSTQLTYCRIDVGNKSFQFHYLRYDFYWGSQ